MAVRNYKKLPGMGRQFGGYETLWLGPDHLLGVYTIMGFSERYKRYYYEDVQAIIIRRTWRHIVGNVIAGLLGLLFLYWLSSETDPTGRVILGALAAMFLIYLLYSVFYLGASCVCHLKTAVQTEKLGSVNRIKTARRVMAKLEPRIREAQGAA